jgi:hypothetical protein
VAANESHRLVHILGNAASETAEITETAETAETAETTPIREAAHG